MYSWTAGQLVQLDSWTAQQIAAGAEWNEIPEYPGTCGRILAEFHGTRQRPLFCASRRLLDADERTADECFKSETKIVSTTADDYSRITQVYSGQ